MDYVTGVMHNLFLLLNLQEVFTNIYFYYKVICPTFAQKSCHGDIIISGFNNNHVKSLLPCLISAGWAVPTDGR